MNGKVIGIDHEKCTGCGECEKVCSLFHTGADNPARARIKVVKWQNAERYLPTTCQNCEKPFCVEVCPTKACHRDFEHQRVLIDKDKCIGCKACIMACPFGAPLFDSEERVSIKCDFCDGNPQCAASCEPKAVYYVEADQVGQKRTRQTAQRLSGLMSRYA